jgi:hypothetical protein
MAFAMFLSCSRRLVAMTDAPDRLTPATPEDLADALMYALRFSRGKRVRSADDIMARITAERLVEYLAGAGFVVMKKRRCQGIRAWAAVPTEHAQVDQDALRCLVSISASNR